MRPLRLSEQQWPEGSVPLVSVLCTAYNHENYLPDAIEGFLKQRTTFPVEIIIHDDASTDSSAQIITDYATRYPSLIKPVLQRENQYSRGKRPMPLIAQISQGKYVALCEGDDYWSADSKLQIQFDMLEARPDASACIHRADSLIEPENILRAGMFGPPDVKSEYGIDDLICGENFVPTASIFAKRGILAELPLWLNEVPHGDIVILSVAALQGPLLYSNESMSVYRKHPGGIHSGAVLAEQILNCIRTLVTLGVHLGVGSRASFKTGFDFRMRQLADKVADYERSLQHLEQQHRTDWDTIDRIMHSRTLRVGLALTKLRNGLTRSRNAPESSADG
jgi:glycosyltransferase involved in cell wall biosynthesis